MTESKRERLRAKAKKRLDERLAAAKSQYDQELHAIDIVFRLEKVSNQADDHNNRTSTRNGDLARHVIAVVAELDASSFEAADVESRLHGRGLNGSLSRKSVSNILARLAEEKRFVKVAEKGAGRRPATYSRLAPVP